MRKRTRKASAAVIDVDALSKADLERIYQESLKAGPASGKALTASQRALHRRINRKAGRPPIGKGSRRLNITLERTLLAAADRLARRKGLSRSELIAAGLRHLVRSA